MANLILWNSLSREHVPIRPAGPHQLAHWLRLNGYTVKVIDFCHLLGVETLVNLTLKHLGPDTVAIGVSSTFWKNHEELKNTPETSEPQWVVDARMRLSRKNVKWLLGGANSTKNYNLEWIVLHGHAEDSLLKFMDEQTSRTQSRSSFDIKNLENCFYDDLAIQSTEVLPIELSRGCQFKCKFCRYPLLGKKKNTYIRDYNLIEQEFIENYEKFGITKYFFLDDTVNESDEKIEALANIAQRLPFKLQWIGYNRLDLIGSKPHTAELLKLSGLKSAFFGIESFHPSASKVVGKGWNGVHGKEFILKLREEWGDQINFHLAFITGITGETPQDTENTQQWCIENNIPSWRFVGLHINKNNDQVWTSEFDRNYSMYGYKFPFESNSEFWINKNWTRKSAYEKAISLGNDAMKYLKVASWELGEISTLGYDLDFLMKQYRHTLNWNEMINRTRLFVDQYVKKQLD